MTLALFHRANKTIQLPWYLSSKESTCNAGGSDSIPGLGRSPGEENVTHSSILTWEIP